MPGPSRRIHQNLATQARPCAWNAGLPVLLRVSKLTRALAAHRWFVLKQGKIFWFKSDIITPVRCLASAHTGLEYPTLLVFPRYRMD